MLILYVFNVLKLAGENFSIMVEFARINGPLSLMNADLFFI